MDIKRKATRGIAVLAVALVAGHLVQNMGATSAPKPVASAELAKKPATVETLAAGPEMAPVDTAQVFGVPVREDAAPVAAAPAALSVAAPSPAAVMLPVIKPATISAALGPVDPSGVTPKEPVQAKGALMAPVGHGLQTAEPIDPAPAAACDVTLDLMTEANAMIGITLVL